MKYQKGSFITIPNADSLLGLNPMTQCLFMWICSFADSKGRCFPSRVKLSKNSGICMRSIDIHLTKLVDIGLIKKEKRKDGKKNLSNLYQIIIKENGGGALNALGGIVHQMHEGSAYLAGRGGAYNATGTKPIITKPLNSIAGSPPPAPVSPPPPDPIPMPKEWILEEKLKEMEKVENSHLDIIATFIRKKGVKIENSKQLSEVIKRYCKKASEMSGTWSNERIFENVAKIKKDNEERIRKKQEPVDWTLETIYKYLTK